LGGEHIAEGNDTQLIDGFEGSLSTGIVGSQRLDGVTDEFEADRFQLPGGVDVENPSPDCEFAVFVRRIFAAETRVNQQRAQIAGGNLLPGLELDRCRHQALWGADSRQQGGR
jgi:hypothetical protein